MTKNLSSVSGKFTRRRFLNSCVGCSACMAAMPLMTMNAYTEQKRMRLRIIYSLHDIVQPGPRETTSKISVYADVEGKRSFMGSMDFRVLNLPDPTAVVEGLALKVAADEVPDIIKGVYDIAVEIHHHNGFPVVIPQ